MSKIPDPLKAVLRNFCHVEWFEVDELAQIIADGQAEFDVDAFRRQLDELLVETDTHLSEINLLTANEFESSGEARAWLGAIRDSVFGK